MLTLTVAEIVDLAQCAGLVLKEGCEPDADELETEIVVMECPKAGLRGDDGRPTHYAHIAYFAEYPEEGSYPLGPEIIYEDDHQNAVQSAAGGLTQTTMEGGSTRAA